MNPKNTRRDFLKTGLAAGTAVSTLTGLSTRAYSRVIGANDQIRIGSIGCGGRGRWHMGWLHRTSETENLEIMAVCDIWDVNRANGEEEVKKRFSNEPKLFKDYRKLLEDKDIDAVVIATPDHQHCPMLADAVKAGKDVYVEKPIAVTLQELIEANDVVKASDRIVQHGTQGRSSAGAAAAREFIQSGKIGKLLRVEESRSHYIPYWNNYACPKTEAETDWQAFLYNRPYRPFNPDQHGCWMGYRDFSSGTVGGWMSHMSDFIHYLTDCGFPAAATTQGGIYSPTSDPRRTCPDTVTAILHYAEGFVTTFTTHFGNSYNDYMLLFGDKGTLIVNDPDGNTGGIAPRVVGKGSEHPDSPKEEIVGDNTTPEDHMLNWARCIRSRKQPNACMDNGYKHGVACILADAAYVEGRRMTYDPVAREIRPA